MLRGQISLMRKRSERRERVRGWCLTGSALFPLVPQRARQDSGSGPAPGPRSGRSLCSTLLHSEAYIKYIEVSTQFE